MRSKSWTDKEIVVRLLKALWRGSPAAPVTVVLSVCCLLLSKLASLTVPLCYKKIVDAVSAPGSPVNTGLLLVGLYGLTRLSMVLIGELRDVFFVRGEQKAIRDLSRSVFSHLHQLSMSFHLNRKTGELKRFLERGGRAIENFFRYLVFNLFPTFLELLSIIGIIFFLYSWVFGLIILMTLVAYVVVTFWISSWRLKFMRRMNEAGNVLGAKEVDSLLNAATVKYFCTADRETRDYDQSLGVYAQEAKKNRWSLAFLNAMQGSILTAGIAGIMAVSIPPLSAGQMQVGDFVMLNTYLLQVYGPLYIMGFAYRELKQAFIDMEGFFGLLKEPQEVADAPDAKRFTYKEGHIQVQDLSFHYDAQRPVLKNVSFEVMPGQTVALVGGSGSGKSTLVSLVLRFFDPKAGRILIDGQDLLGLKQDSFRRHMGVVSQDTVLFNNTLAYNIGYGKENASMEEVIQASKEAALHDFVMTLPDGYETIVGERGLKLSGGEKQRVGIARALLIKPDIFLFDEATSALDTQTESDIQKSIEASSKGRTTLIIAHRLSTVVKADKIIVLQDGQIIECGKHRTLLRKKGAYADMWEQQKHDQEEAACAFGEPKEDL